MPHIHLETSSNLEENQRIEEILGALVRKLSSFETVESSSVKAYHTLRQIWAMGTGAAPGFIHCTVAVLSGRPPELRSRISEGISQTILELFSSTSNAGLAGVTVEVREMERSTYVKINP